MGGDCQEKKLLIHIHVPKCAGTSVNSYIGHHFPERCLAYSNPQDYARFLNMSRVERNDKYSAVFGHLKFGVHEKFDKDYVYFSVLRSPISRICSYFNYVHLVENHPDHLLFKKYFPTIDHISEEAIFNVQSLRDNILNYACWAYSGVRCETSSDWDSASRIIEEQIKGKRLVLGSIEYILQFLMDSNYADEGAVFPAHNTTLSLIKSNLDFQLANYVSLNPKTKMRLLYMNAYDQKLFDRWNADSINVQKGIKKCRNIL